MVAFDRPKPKISWNLFRGLLENHAPEVSPAGEGRQFLCLLAARQPGRHQAGRCHRPDGHDSDCGCEEPAYPVVGREEAQSCDEDPEGRLGRSSCG